MQIRSIVAVALLAVPTTILAQGAPSDTVFARSPWAAEAAIGGTPTASLLHVGPGGGAWLFALAGNVSHSETDVTPIFGQAQKNTVDAGQVALELGRRKYRGVAPLRPFVGAGVIGSYGGADGTHQYGAGVYGELGASYFVVPHLGVGVGEQLTFNYNHSWVGTDARANAWTLSLPFPALRVTVIF